MLPPRLRWCLALSIFLSIGFAPEMSAQSYAFTTIAGSPGFGFADGTGAAARFGLPGGIAVGANGNIYVSDYRAFVVRMITPAGVVTTMAGSPGNIGYVEGTGSAARFGSLYGLIVDSGGNVYVCDATHSTIRRISASGVVGTYAGVRNQSGTVDGPIATAQFMEPRGLAVDNFGNLFVADSAACTIRKIAATGTVSTIAGLAGTPGGVDGVGSAARFKYPAGIVVDASGNLFVSDSDDATIRKITPDGTVTTFAGAHGLTGSADGIGTAARFSSPAYMAIDTQGDLLVADRNSHTIRAISPTGAVTTIAGQAGFPGYVDGAALGPRFNQPAAVAVDRNFNVYIADTDNSTIRKLDSNLNLTTIAGQPGAGASDGVGMSAHFFLPGGLALDSANNIYVADTYNHTIRKVTPAGVVTTVAGAAGVQGTLDGVATDARFRYPYGVVVDAAKNLYVADTGNHAIRKITPTGLVGTLAGLAHTPGAADGVGTVARFNTPVDIKLDSAGNLIVADAGNDAIRQVKPDGTVTTIAGQLGVAGSADGPAAQASFSRPQAIAFDGSGNLFIADAGNNTIRKRTPGGTVSTVAGEAGVSGSNDGVGTAAHFYFPEGIAVDAYGDIFVSDNGNNLLREIGPDGTVTTIGGIKSINAFADGIGSSSEFFFPGRIALDTVGNLYLADSYNCAIRKGGLVAAASPTSRLVNLSVRANLVAGDRLITGFYVQGAAKNILVRAVGPGLAPYVGTTQTASDPRLEMYDGALNLVQSNDDWGGGAALRDAFASVGAFPLDATSHDAAAIRQIAGLQSVHVLTTGTGLVLVEAYDTGSNLDSRLTNVSTRYQVGTGAQALVAGFVIGGSNQKTLLIRGVGPTLASYGVTDALTDPRIDLFNDAQQKISSNNDWAPGLATTFSQVGAFGFITGSKDAALLVTLPPGLYSAQLSGNDGGTGEGLIEVYEVGN